MSRPPGFGSSRCFFCKILAFLFLLYALGHFLFIRPAADLGWMPPPPDLSHVTDSMAKKHPDGPLVMNDGILAEEKTSGKSRKLTKIVLMDPSQMDIDADEDDVKIKGGGGGGGEEETENAKKKARRKNKLPISEQFLAKFRQTAKQIHQKHSPSNGGFVLFALLNRAYLDLTLNWLCNLYALPKDTAAKQQNSTASGDGNKGLLKATLLVALDGGEVCKEVKKHWKEVTCMSMFEKDKKGKNKVALLEADEQKEYNEALSWGRLRYVHILTARANLMAALAESKVQFVLAESDAIWLRNPFPGLFANATLLEDADVVMPLNSGQGSAKGQRFAFDPMVTFTTNESRRLLQEMRRILNREATMMDQDLLNELCSQQYMGVVCREFIQADVADGAWFKLSEPERARMAQTSGHWPFIVNNNFYVGVQNKMARQAINGLWFLSAKQKVCNLAKAKRILQKYQQIT